MKIKTEDCVDAIIEHYKKQAKNFDPHNLVDYEYVFNLTNSNNWKRRAKYGSKADKITREFENTMTGNKVYVYSTEETILEVVPMETKAPSTEEPCPEIAEDFKFKFVGDFATIYSNDNDQVNDGDIIDPQEMRDDNYDKYTIKKGTRIGYFDWGEDTLNGVIVVTDDMNYYNYEKKLISDGIITFEISKNKGFVPAQEPVDVLGDWQDVEHKNKLQGFVKKYKLDHLLWSM